MDVEERPEAAFLSSPELPKPELGDVRPSLESEPLTSSGVQRSRAARTPNPNHSSRLVALDAARVVATLAVVWVHVVEVQGHGTGVAALGRFGTSFYVIAAVLLAFRTTVARPARTLRDGNITRVKRLLVPYLLWTVIYGAYYGYHAFAVGTSFQVLAMWWGPFAGTARHLWFLPFAFFTGAVAQAIVPKLVRLTRQQLRNWLIFGTLGSYAFFYGFVFYAINHDYIVDWHLHRLDRWIEEIPLATLALLGSAYFHHPEVRAKLKKRTYRYERTLVFLAVIFAVEFAYGTLIEDLREINGAEGRYLANIVGLAVLSLFLDLGDNRITRRMARFGKYTYFAFLSHVLLLDSTSMFVGHLPGFGSLWFAAVSTLLLFLACLSVGWLVRRTAPLRWLSP